MQMTELHQPAATNQQPPSAWQPNQPNYPGGAIGVQTTEKTSLPAGWYSAVDPASGNTYYVDPQNQTHWNLPSSELPISQMDIATVRAELEKDDIAPDRAAALHGRLQQLDSPEAAPTTCQTETEMADVGVHSKEDVEAPKAE